MSKSKFYDRLIEDTDRRNKGKFYTPKLFADYAHKMISEALGDNWKDDYVVWDNCCGTKNLTRDYRFKELYCSTLENAELDISSRYNPEATSFQYDFLNDPLEKLPKGLLEAFEQNKKIVFFLNPPYGAPGHNDENGKGVGGVTAGTVNTKIASEMKSKNIGRCSSNLYTQFLYRINIIKNKYNLTNIYIAIFSPKSLLTSSSYNVFRNIFLNNFKFINACQFQASHFANVASSWAISFSIWKNGINENKNDFVYNTIDNINGDIQITNKSIVYNIDGHKAINDFINKNNILEQKEFLSCGALMKITGITKMPINSLGGYHSHGNDFMHNASFVNILPTGKSICENNFEQVCTVVGTRKLIEVNWENNKNEHILPDVITTNYINNCIVYCLFNSAVYNYSLRQIKYHDKLWDIKNEFFWMSKSEIESLANEYNNDDCYNDAHTSPDRFVYKKLQEITLTPEAQAVLDKACDIVRKTFKYRELFNEEHPEYQINNWDCGWYQIKALAKEYAKEDLEEFKKLYKALADKMRPMVYELGFLK